MPVNKRGGKKHKRNKNYASENSSLRIKAAGQEYAKIVTCKGNCRFDVECSDGKNRAAILCGSMRKRRYVNNGDLVLVSLRDFQDKICDIIDVYNESQAKRLEEDKHLPESFRLGEENPYEDYTDEIHFTNEMPSSEEECGDTNNSSDESSIDLTEI